MHAPPAAGQGEGCKRCSACKAAWFCGTHRIAAPHKHACGALAEERQAATEAARAARSGGGRA